MIALERPPVMIVEDDQDGRDALQMVIEHLGYRVVTSQNGREALHYLEECPAPCLILLDLMMPIMTGLEFLQVRKDHSQWREIPVIVLSAVPDRVDPSLRATVADIITKPLDFNALTRALVQHCPQ